MVLSNFSNLNILCIGDIILDSYIHGNVNRISPEAPIPVFKYESERFVLGGAGNVARNVVSGGGSCNLISVVGNDEEFKILSRLVQKTKNLKASLILENRKTTLNHACNLFFTLESDRSGPEKISLFLIICVE
tara:strand:- start:601 stop:999 length:399 start_codon:yes stop_codon:yes gene_type:complete